MDLKKGQIVDTTIEKLAFGGSGIGKCRIPKALSEAQPSAMKADGMVMFVPNVIPGDQLRVALTAIKKNRLEGKAEEIVKPSDLRVEARCKHFDECGGCTWQNLSYENQLKFKEQQVIEALHHVGGFKAEFCEEIVRPIIGCKDPWDYRNKMEFSFGTPSKEDQTPMLGLHQPKQRYSVFDLEECHLPSPYVAEIVKKVRQFVLDEGLTVYHNGRGKGLLRNLLIREGKNTGELMVALVISEEAFNKFKDKFIALFEDDEKINSLVKIVKIQKRGVRTSLTPTTLAGADVIHEELNLENGQTLRFEISPDAFFQPNTKQAEILYGQAIALAELDGDEVVYDLYCGTGTIGMFCAHASKEVYGIELNEQAVKNAKQNAKRNEIENIHFLAGDVGKVLGQTFESIGGPPPPPDVVIVDPPRAGLQGDAPLKVADLGAGKIVYVSCNPATLSRDLKTFTENGYQLQSVQPVDMFPQTYHIENVALLTKT
jgi:23S rRNA (uracil1939-C5)-methyltransferase